MSKRAAVPSLTLGELSEQLAFDRSPGGTPEVTAEFVRQHAGNLLLVDVREKPELVGDLGHIPGAEWVPLRHLARKAAQWERDRAIVLVDRSGRRSGEAAAYLDRADFTRVASMTGGMLAWRDHRFAVSRDADFGAARQPNPAAKAKKLTAADLEIHLGDSAQVRWTKAAALLLHGTESCVDGRDPHAVIGTPGGDAGELLLGLTTIEAVTGHVFTREQVAAVFDDYVDAFGHFYMHTDEHALHALGKRLAADPAFAGYAHAFDDLDEIEQLMRKPPRALRSPLLAHLQQADAIGCGHLALIRTHPQEYEVREELTVAFISAFFDRLWSDNRALEYVVLAGDHREGAVVNVLLENEVHPYTAVPMIVPRYGDTEIFVNHPQVADFIRKQNAVFLLEKLDWAQKRGIDEEEFLKHLRALAARQLKSTVGYLAPDLPVFDVKLDDRALTITQH